MKTCFMNDYTQKTRDWLDVRFRQTDSQGVYFAHQPIYGFRMGHCEKSLLHRYIITYHIMHMLSHFTFESLIDVGGAEGYKGAMVRHLFGAGVKSCDLSQEACDRADEIYNVDSQAIDVQDLPFETDSFDIVLCSEVLEHVQDFETAVEQLVRVSRKAVIITLPHESQKHVEKHRTQPHAHLRSFSLSSLDYLESRGFDITRTKMNNPFLKPLGLIVEAMPRNHSRFKPLWNLYNRSLPLLRVLFGQRSMEFLIHLDSFASRVMSYNSMMFVIFKDTTAYSTRPLKQIRSRHIVDFAVPYHYLRNHS
ncbi:MAG: class I SAM-dependent methyltransferase [Gemmatimonadetes bacterium]|nr:class I SAM-dependent methyltransferase [Gemmatimonadota bacterium]MYG85851.1 class I SAM-dependent methyltransferase [Gemmatimonadota bacterium]MYJ89733.1 class I SAM-dependent methyltransferase [Gemmatimonadota bacterium]